MVADASTAKARNPSPGLEDVNDFAAVLPIGPLAALVESPTSLKWDRAYIELMTWGPDNCLMTMKRCLPVQPMLVTDWTGFADTA